MNTPPIAVYEQPSSKPGKMARFRNICQRDQNLLLCLVVLIVLENVPYGNYVLYPFTFFSTWVHEMGHGLAAIVVGGRIDTLYIYEDGSGLAYTTIPNADGVYYPLKRAFVSSGGFSFTAIVGGIMLLFRWTKLGPKIGLISIGSLMLLSCALWVRNTFAIIMLITMGVSLIVLALVMKVGKGLGTVYAFLAGACCLNAVVAVHRLFESDEISVNGSDRDSDAETVSSYIGMPYQFWAATWFLQSLAMFGLGLLYPFEPAEPIQPSEPVVFPSTRTGATESTSPYYVQVV